MVMTSVSGHLLTHDFIDAYKQWQSCDPISLFEAPVVKFCPENYVKIKLTLEREVSVSNNLVSEYANHQSNSVLPENAIVIKQMHSRFAAHKASLYGRIATEKVKISVLKSSMCVELSSQISECIAQSFPKLHQPPYFVRSIMWLSLTYDKVKRLMYDQSSIWDLVLHLLDSKLFDIKRYFQSSMALFRTAVVKYQRLDLLLDVLMILKNSFHKNFGNWNVSTTYLTEKVATPLIIRMKIWRRKTYLFCSNTHNEQFDRRLQLESPSFIWQR